MLVQVVLFVRDASAVRRLQGAFRPLDAVVDTAPDDADPLAVLRRGGVDLVVIDEASAGPDASTLIPSIRETVDAPEVVVITESQDPTHHTTLMGVGVRAVIGHRDEPYLWRSVFEEIVAARAADMVVALRARSNRRHGRLSDFAAESDLMKAFIKRASKVIRADTTVLVHGETGVGKERLAHIIHDEGPRADGPFVAINCAAIPESLLESELFGHEKGAFTNADRARRGKFEQAHGGTIFLDEIGEMPLSLQPKLLRVLQEREVERIGGDRSLPVDIRVITATNRKLEELVGEGAFRADLYYRLAVMSLEIPPLRERQEDIPSLALRFLEQYSAAMNKTDITFSTEAIRALQAYPWPGNVRELMNVIERAVLLCESDSIELVDLPDPLVQARVLETAESHEIDPGPKATHVIESLGFEDESLLELPWGEARAQLLTRLEYWYLTKVLERTGGRVGKAAEIMKLSPRSLYTKMKQHGIDKRDFKGRKSD